MKVVRPAFREGKEWRKLTPAERNGSRWKYILLRELFIEVETGLTLHYDLYDKAGRKWGMLLPHGIVICAEYAWDGCSKSPDWELLASVPHDLLFQFCQVAGFPLSVITNCWADCLFFALCVTWAAVLFFSGLRIGSWKAWNRKNIDDEFIKIHPLLQSEPT